MAEQLRKTSLVEEHLRLGAKMVDFHGWYLPIQYSGLVEEHHAVRQAAGLFDVSHMGEIRVRGKDALALMDSLTVNEVLKLQDNQAQYTALTTERGTVIDDLLIYRFAADHLLLVVNAANQDEDFAWIDKHSKGFEVTVRDEGPETGQIAIQGPHAEAILQKVAPIDLSQMGYYRFAQSNIGGVAALISRTGYTGEDGFECYAHADQIAQIWRLLLEHGRADGLQPAGLGARDTLRLEARMLLHGSDMDQTTTVLEAGLGWITKLKKPADFTGKAALLAQKQVGPERRLVGFEMIDKGIARGGFPIIQDGRVVGKVTSGTYSPTLKTSIGLAYLPAAMGEPDSEIQIQIRNKTAAARVVKGPFYKRPVQ